MKILAVLFMGFLLFELPVQADSESNDFQLTSPAFEANTAIPKKYTCSGQDINPPLVFKNVPAQTKSRPFLSGSSISGFPNSYIPLSRYGEPALSNDERQ